MAKRYIIKFPLETAYYYSSDKCLSEMETTEKDSLESKLYKYIHVTEVGAHNANSSVSVRITKEGVELVISGCVGVEEVSNL